MANDTVLNTPTLWINKYLQNKLQDIADLGDVPFFPTQPTTIDTLTQTFPAGEVFATYDRMLKMNRKAFPHIKSEQLMYYFYAVGSAPSLKVIKATETVFRLLDRGDESAEEVNNWCSNRRIVGVSDEPIDSMFYFHNFKVYQLEETRDIIDFGTARTYAGNKIIIDFEYHQMPSLTNNDWEPEYLATKEEI